MRDNIYVNLRGTSGAGKSTVAHTLLARNPFTVVEWWEGARSRKPLVYRVDASFELSLDRPLFLFGSYHTQCGGCDGIQDYQNVVPRLLDQYGGQGHALFEGLLLSGGFGSVGRGMVAAAKRYRATPIWALLDTPLEVSLARIEQRRASRGVTEPLNPKNTQQKYDAAHKAHAKMLSEGHRSVLINHKRPYSSVVQLFGAKITREPSHATFKDHD